MMKDVNVVEYLQKELGLGEEEAVERARAMKTIFGRQKIVEAIYCCTGVDVSFDETLSLDRLDRAAAAFNGGLTGRDELNILVQQELITEEQACMENYLNYLAQRETWR